jgi:membrane-associated protein
MRLATRHTLIYSPVQDLLSMLPGFIEFFVNIDQNLPHVIGEYGLWTYLILFLIIMLETGLVILPFLPGDSLLFVAGTAAAKGVLSLPLIILVLAAAAVIGDSINYSIGNYMGLSVFRKKFPYLVKKEYIDRTYDFYEKYGGLTIVIARFVPVIRSLAPFLAGVGTMQYRKFLLYNIIGAVLWTLAFVLAGYFIGMIPIVQDNFNLVIYFVLAIAVLSAGGVVYGIIRSILSGKPDEGEEGPG